LATERDAKKARRANADYVATERDANADTKKAKRARRFELLDERSAELNSRDLFQSSAIANEHCLNQD
jgi:hypothetical protein